MAATVYSCFVSHPDIYRYGESSVAGHPALGCWELRPGETSNRFLPGRLAVRLDTSAGSFSQWRVFADTTMLPGRRRLFSTWAPVRQGSAIYVHLGNGYTGVGMTFKIRNDTMRGSSMATSDVGGPTIGASVLGVRVPCRV